MLRLERISWNCFGGIWKRFASHLRDEVCRFDGYWHNVLEFLSFAKLTTKLNQLRKIIMGKFCLTRLILFVSTTILFVVETESCVFRRLGLLTWNFFRFPCLLRFQNRSNREFLQRIFIAFIPTHFAAVSPKSVILFYDMKTSSQASDVILFLWLEIKKWIHSKSVQICKDSVYNYSTCITYAYLPIIS